MNPQLQITDAVGLSIFVLGYIFPEQAAQIFGPYLVIIAAAALGASFATIRREPTSRIGGIWFFTRVIGLAILVSVSVAQHLSQYYPGISVRASLALVAFVFGIVADDWPTLGRWIARRVMGKAFGSTKEGPGHD